MQEKLEPKPGPTPRPSMQEELMRVARVLEGLQWGLMQLAQEYPPVDPRAKKLQGSYRDDLEACARTLWSMARELSHLQAVTHGGSFSDTDLAEAAVWPRKRMQQDGLDHADNSDVDVEGFLNAGRRGNLRFDDDGNLVSSLVDLQADVFMPILDLDIPHTYVPSGTSGHGHLYLDIQMSAAQQELLVTVLVGLGVLGQGSATQLQAWGMNMVRRPSLKKGDQAASEEDRCRPLLGHHVMPHRDCALDVTQGMCAR